MKMTRSKFWTLAGTLAFASLAIAVPALGQNGKNAGQAQPQGSKNPPASDLKAQEGAVDASQYVGAETCKTCHEQVGASYDKRPHWKTALVKHTGPDYQGCEACHGPGKAHAESGDPDKILRMPSLSREASSKVCLKCHEFGQEHADFLRSEHVKNNVGCIDCHAIHAPRVQEHLLKAAQPALCFTCHQGVKQDSSKPFHHGVDEGLAKCSKCHNPHGGLLKPQSQTTPAREAVRLSYQLPASLAAQFSRNPTYKTSWNYYDYNEKSNTGPTPPRDSRSNTFTLLLRYSM